MSGNINRARRLKVFRARGIRWRMAMLYLSLFAVGLSVFCAVLFHYFQRTQLEAFDTTLYNFAVDIGSNLEMDFVGRVFPINSSAAEAGKWFPFHLGGSFLEIRDIDGKSLMHSRSLQEKNLPFDRSVLTRMPTERAIFRTIQARDHGLRSTSPDLRLLTYWAHRAEWNRPLLLQVAVPLELPNQERRNLLVFFFLAIPAFLLICGVAGLWLSRRVLRPVHEMTLKARGITGVAKLGERIPVAETKDEIAELAVTFNSLLDRLETAFASQDRFISNASHQLKTPLTILKGELEMLRKAPPSGTDLSSSLDSVGAEINRLIQLVQDLLLLARLEAGRDTIALMPTRVDEVLMKVVARMQKLGKGKKVQVLTQFTADILGDELNGVVNGDEDLLDSMFENFIENAIKYSPPDSAVELAMRTAASTIEITIRDYGPGIPAELNQKIFERFTRVEPSSIVPGSGLGLSIAAEIARLHSVQIHLLAANPGTRVILTIPRLISI